MRVFAPSLPALAALLLPVVLTACTGKDKDAPAGDDTSGGTDSGTTDPFADDDIGAWLSLAATADGKIAAAAYDRTADGLAYGTATPGADPTWAWEAVDSFPDDNGLNPGDAGKYAAMAMTADGTPWIVYQDTTNKSLKYATKVSGAWTTGIVDSGGGGRPDAGYWASIAIAGSGFPVVAMHDEGEGELRISRWDGAAWQHDTPITGEASADETGAPIEADVGEYSSLAVGPAGTEYVAYYDRAWGDLKLAMNTGGSWSVETIDSDGDVGQWPDIAISGGILYIAYHDVTNQDLKLATGTPGSWSIQTLDTGDYVGADSAVYAADGTVSVAYFDGVNNDIKKATGSGSSFSTSTHAGTDLALGYHNEVVAVGGTTYVGCYDYTNRRVWLAPL